jgi:hypothetical protein
VTHEWIKKMWYVYTSVLFSHKENEIMLFAGKRMDDIG